jgi:SAM-dependent methyltransferase
MKSLEFEIRSEYNQKSHHYIELDFLKGISKSKIYVSTKTGLCFQKDYIKKQENNNKWNEIFSNQFVPEKGLFTSENPFFLSRHYYATIFLKQYLSKIKLKKKLNILDAGAGEGNLGYLIKKFISNVDISIIEILKKNIYIMKKKYPIKEIYHGPIEDSFFFKTKKFDICALTWTLCNCSSPIAVLEKINSLLNNDGLLLIGESSRVLVPYKKMITSYFHSQIHTSFHPWHFSFNSINNLLEVCGFRICYVNNFNEENDMFIIANKIHAAKKHNLKLHVDKLNEVITFFKKWKKESIFFKKIVNNNYNSN